ncbi:DUF6053 domain-containing protein [Lysobacter sp. TAB13]
MPVGLWEGLSAPMLLFQIAAICAQGVGAEAPPTRAGAAPGPWRSV